MQWNTKSLVPSKLNQLCSSNIKPWNNGKEVPRLDLTSLTTPGQQIHYGRPHLDSKYNKSVWLSAVLPCRAPATPTPLFDNTAAACLLHLLVVEGLIFCISATLHLGTSFPLFHEWVWAVSAGLGVWMASLCCDIAGLGRGLVKGLTDRYVS